MQDDGLTKGGQGRDTESVQSDAISFLRMAILAALIVLTALLALRGTV